MGAKMENVRNIRMATIVIATTCTPVGLSIWR